MMTEHQISQRQVCKAVGLPRSTHQYKPVEKKDSEIIDALNRLVEKHPAIGFWQSFYRLRLAGRPWNHKKVYRVYTGLQMNIRRRRKKRLPARVKQALFQPSEANEVWSIDFMCDSLWNGRRFRLLNIVDDFNREVYLKEVRGLPKMIRVDNGPEFISHKLDAWYRESKITLFISSPASPPKMPIWNVLMAVSDGSCWMPMCSTHYRMCALKPKNG